MTLKKGKPNILLIETHDSGCLFGCYGVSQVKTPNIDSLAEEGVRLTNFFGPSPICSPSRATLTTGLYPQTHGVVGGCHAPDFNQLEANERHISRILADNGYNCESFGLAHESIVGDQMGFHKRNYEIRPTLERYSCEVLAPVVNNFINKAANTGKPFYAQVGFFETHQPFDFGGVKPDESNGIHMPAYLLRCDENEQKMALLQGSLKRVDEYIGTIFDTIKKAGMKENTIIIFTVDHGIEMPRAKFTLYDPGIHIPFIIRWPEGGLTGGREFSNLTGNIDILPTLLELLEIQDNKKIQGVSFAEKLKGDTVKPHREYVYACLFGKDARAIRSENCKLIRNFSPRKQFSPPVDPKCPFIPGSSLPLIELYDLQNDPNEFYNVADEPHYESIKQELDMELWKWMLEVNDPLFKGGTPFRMWYECMEQCPPKILEQAGDK